MSKKLTITDILEQKELAKRKLSTKTLYIPSLDAEITVQEPSRALAVEAFMQGAEKADTHIVYHCVTEPNLKQNHVELMKHFGCATPYEIVDHIFKPGEIPAISQEILQMAGYVRAEGSKIVEEVKN